MRQPKPSGRKRGGPAPHLAPSAYYHQLALAQSQGVRFSPETRKAIALYLDLRRREGVRRRAEEAIERGIRRRSLRISVMKTMGYICSCYGESLTVAQTIDHVSGGGCLERKTVKDSWGRAAENPEGLQLLCLQQEIARNIFRGGPVLLTYLGSVLAA